MCVSGWGNGGPTSLGLGLSLNSTRAWSLNRGLLGSWIAFRPTFCLALEKDTDSLCSPCTHVSTPSREHIEQRPGSPAQNCHGLAAYPELFSGEH